MLPDIGTPERNSLEQEAHDVAMQFLREEFGNIPNALYRTYMYFRDKFSTSGVDITSESMTDARQLEALVADDWSAAISEHFADAERPY